MKRQQFRLGNVLRYYELQKQRAELDLQRASRILQETDAEISGLEAEIANVAWHRPGEPFAGTLAPAIELLYASAAVWTRS